MTAKIDKHGRKALLSLVFAGIFILSIGVNLGLGQECDGTQFKTDDRGLVYLRKGEKQKLLIWGRWCICEGCGNCIPVSSVGQQRPVVQKSLQQKQQEQELAEQQMMEEIERVSALRDKVTAEDEARMQAERFAFQDRMSLLSRELKSLQAEPLPKFQGLKLKLQDLAEQATTIQEIGNIARWSLKAAREAFFYSSESAREMASWGFDDWKNSAGVIDISQFTPDVSVPETWNPQYIAFKHIAGWASDMYVKLLRLGERAGETFNKGIETEHKMDKMVHQLGSLTAGSEEERKKKETIGDLKREAEALEKEAQQMLQKSREYLEEVSDMEKELTDMLNDPARCLTFLERQEGKK